MEEQMDKTKDNMSVLDRIEDAIEDIKQGKVIIVVDDENRENEGDFLAAAETVSPEMINFMASHGRGLICAPLTEGRCRQLGLERMVSHNTDPLETAFTVSVDLKGHGVTTGISASDRAKTITALTKEETQPHHLSRPGHIFPLIAKEGGVLRRTGHTEAAIDFARLAGFAPAGVIVEIMNADGSMARLPQLLEVAKNFQLKIVSIEDLVKYRMEHDSLIEKKMDFPVQTRFGSFRLRAYKQTTNQQIHLALTKGSWKKGDPVLTKISPTQIHHDLLSSLTQDQNQIMERIFQAVAQEESAAVVFINQDINHLGMLSRLQIVKENQSKEIYQAPPIEMDAKDFGVGAQILHDLGINKIKLLSNATQVKRVGMIGYGLEIIAYQKY
jgi:3,4-dihydroxy 2-butanone 4-phosphate synthase/GTP cyclohydrolase II